MAGLADLIVPGLFLIIRTSFFSAKGDSLGLLLKINKIATPPIKSYYSCIMIIKQKVIGLGVGKLKDILGL